MVQRSWLRFSLTLVLLSTLGCVAATVKGNRFGTDREAVVVNGQVFVIDKTNGAVMKVDVSTAGPFVPCKSEAELDVD